MRNLRYAIIALTLAIGLFAIYSKANSDVNIESIGKYDVTVTIKYQKLSLKQIFDLCKRCNEEFKNPEKMTISVVLDNEEADVIQWQNWYYHADSTLKFDEVPNIIK